MYYFLYLMSKLSCFCINILFMKFFFGIDVDICFLYVLVNVSYDYYL